MVDWLGGKGWKVTQHTHEYPCDKRGGKCHENYDVLSIVVGKLFQEILGLPLSYWRRHVQLLCC
jgi:hypothetical protein